MIKPMRMRYEMVKACTTQGDRRGRIQVFGGKTRKVEKYLVVSGKIILKSIIEN
jgi:hypothetical protein